MTAPTDPYADAVTTPTLGALALTRRLAVDHGRMRSSLCRPSH